MTVSELQRKTGAAETVKKTTSIPQTIVTTMTAIIDPRQTKMPRTTAQAAARGSSTMPAAPRP
jgi:hypothetical protein